jgi:hypothetical protein
VEPDVQLSERFAAEFWLCSELCKYLVSREAGSRKKCSRRKCRATLGVRRWMWLRVFLRSHIEQTEKKTNMFTETPL